ncbi:MAG: hypothetical protein HQL75_15585 [Magnetococcales bacterium]|nr:hypothetical protein [Magnetococcales bacterium]
MGKNSRGKIATNPNVDSSPVEGSKLASSEQTPQKDSERLYGEKLFGEGMVQASCLRKISHAEMAKAFGDFEPE